MFEKICVPPIQPQELEFDLGLLAESLLFYDSTFLIIKHTNLLGLIRGVGPEVLIELIEEHNLKVRFLHRQFSAITMNKNTPNELFGVATIHAPKYDLENVASKAFVEATGKSGKGRRLAVRFCRSVSEVEYAKDITDSIREDMKEGTCIERFLSRRLITLGADKEISLPKKFRYYFTRQSDQGFKLETNFNFQEKNIPIQELIDPAAVLADYGTTVANMTIWAQMGSEVAVYPSQSDVIGARISGLLEKYKGNQDKIPIFQDFVFNDSHSISQAINGNHRKFSDLLRVLKQARKFKAWLISQPVDKDLLKEYHKKATENTWIEKLPGKSARFLFFTAAGLGIDKVFGTDDIGKIAGVTMSALDTFFLDHFVKGWRPNQFVEGPLKKFLDQK